MAEPAAGPRLIWTRRSPGSRILLFLFLSAALWTASLLAWEVRQPELVVGFLAVGAFLPLVWLGAQLRTRALWALQVRGDQAVIMAALRQALQDRKSAEVVPAQGNREGLFRRCETLLRIEQPPCLLGVEGATVDPWTTLLLLAKSKDREGLARLRATIASHLSVP